MDTIQLSGVDSTVRKTSGKLGARAKLIIHERIMTDGDEKAKTEFEVELNGEDSGVDLVSRSVAKGNSYQEYHSTIKGNCRCTGHSECDAILGNRKNRRRTAYKIADSRSYFGRGGGKDYRRLFTWLNHENTLFLRIVYFRMKLLGRSGHLEENPSKLFV